MLLVYKGQGMKLISGGSAAFAVMNLLIALG